MSNHTIRVTNNGKRPWRFCIFQEPPPDAYGAHTLAWLASPYPINNGGDEITFTWNIQYQILWAKTGELSPGVIFSADGWMDVDLSSHNLMSFTAPPPTLSQPTKGGPRGSITVNDGPTVPVRVYSIAVGMGTRGLYAINAGPDLQHMFTPNLTYWVGAVDHVIEGQVIIPTFNKAKITFPPDVFGMKATLELDGTWDIKPL